ncbi:MAG: dockerin type I repeat-containing protein [Candidatus Zixiibacteriota bacterium]
MPGYWLVTDVLDGWGGESKSTGYGITVSSGGQAAGIGISESDNYKANTGFIPAVGVKRGDVNQTGLIDIGDVVYLINYLYRAGSNPIPLETGDCNCDGVIDIGDVIYLINYLFKNGLPPCGR